MTAKDEYEMLSARAANIRDHIHAKRQARKRLDTEINEACKRLAQINAKCASLLIRLDDHEVAE